LFVDNCSVRLPDGMNSLFPAKIVIRTGPFYKDKGCAQSEDIDVYLVPPGELDHNSGDISALTDHRRVSRHATER
jgi:hypothetical protein